MTQESGRYMSLCGTLTVARLLDSSSSRLGFQYFSVPWAWRNAASRLLHDLRVCCVGDKIPAAIAFGGELAGCFCCQQGRAQNLLGTASAADIIPLCTDSWFFGLVL